MIALFAGTGDLPAIIANRAGARLAVVCQMQGFAASVPVAAPLLTYRLERLGSLLDDLLARGVTQVCLVGALQRPAIDPALIDAQNAPILAQLVPALALGDDGLLRAILHLFEKYGLAIIGAADLAPDLLPPPGVPTRARPRRAAARAATLGDATVAVLGRSDTGQACVIRRARVVATEDRAGTDAMLARLAPGRGGMLFKAPKPGQDRRVDLPVIGAHTARGAIRAGLSGITIAAGGVMVIDLAQVVALLDAAGLYLWVRASR